MAYKILEIHCIFNQDKLTELAVLWDDNGRVRATYSNLSLKAGYDSLSAADTVTPQLIQRVAGYGSYLDDDRKKRYFGGKREWGR